MTSPKPERRIPFWAKALGAGAVIAGAGFGMSAIKKSGDVVVETEPENERERERDRAISDEARKESSLRIIHFMNELHGQDPARRFAAAEPLDAVGIYHLLVDGESELYTTTYYGLAERLFQRMQREGISGKQLFERVGYKQFRNLIHLFVNYHGLNNFFKTMTPEEGQELIRKYVTEIHLAEDPVFEGALTAELYADSTDEALRAQIAKLVRETYDLCVKNKQLECEKIFGVLAGTLFRAGCTESPWFAEMAKKYDVSEPAAASVDKFFEDGRNIQRYYFYPDEDGKGSFDSFLHLYQDNPNWKIIRTARYVVVQSRGKQRSVEMYANFPDEFERAQQELDVLFRLNKVSAQVVVHRGHSYNVAKSFRGVNNNTALVFLGSCGGYVNLKTLSTLSPACEAIVTRGEGSKVVNDPLLFRINTELARGKDLKWEEIWSAAAKMTKDQRFGAYVRPDQNYTMLFIHAMQH